MFVSLQELPHPVMIQHGNVYARYLVIIPGLFTTSTGKLFCFSSGFLETVRFLFLYSVYFLETRPPAFSDVYFAILAHLVRTGNPLKCPKMTKYSGGFDSFCENHLF